MNNKKSIKMITTNAIGIALVYIATTLLHVQIGESNPNLGDAIIFLFALQFGPVSGLICASVGSLLADLVIYPSTALFSFIIKGLEGLIVGLIAKNVKTNFRLFLSMIIGSIIMIGLYFLAKTFLYGSLETAILSLYSNIIQAILSIIFGFILFKIINKYEIFKEKS